jgi:hypothetical protein
VVNTDAYLLLGITVVVTILGSYSLSLWLRFRQTDQMIQTLETLKEEK